MFGIRNLEASFKPAQAAQPHPSTGERHLHLPAAARDRTMSEGGQGAERHQISTRMVERLTRQFLRFRSAGRFCLVQVETRLRFAQENRNRA